MEFERAKLAPAPNPGAEAITKYPPVVPFAVKVEAVAIPEALVMAVVTFVLVSENLPLGPMAGAVNVTVTPATGLAAESFTITCNAVAKGVLIIACCVPPASTEMVGGTICACAKKVVKIATKHEGKVRLLRSVM